MEKRGAGGFGDPNLLIQNFSTQRVHGQILVINLYTEFSALACYTIGVDVKAAGLGLLLHQGTTSKLTLFESTSAPSQQPRPTT
jgi:hypothetical protein